LHTPTSCVCGYANPSDNWGDVPNTLCRRLAGDRDEAGDIPRGDIPEDANLVAGNLEDVLRGVGGLVRDQLQGDEFLVVELREVSQHQVVEFQVVVVQGGQSRVTGSADYRHRVDRPLRAWREAVQQSVDDSSKSRLQRRFPVAYSDDRG
jgi:hypothetical protein